MVVLLCLALQCRTAGAYPEKLSRWVLRFQLSGRSVIEFDPMFLQFRFFSSEKFVSFGVGVEPVKLPEYAHAGQIDIKPTTRASFFFLFFLCFYSCCKYSIRACCQVRSTFEEFMEKIRTLKCLLTTITTQLWYEWKPHIQ